jgi:hypothetical protein
MIRLRRERARPPAEPCPPDLGWAALRPQSVEGVHLLFLNRPPDDIPPDDGGATIVPASSLGWMPGLVGSVDRGGSRQLWGARSQPGLRGAPRSSRGRRECRRLWRCG